MRLQRSNVNTVLYGTETTGSLGAQIWNLVPKNLKCSKMDNNFESKHNIYILYIYMYICIYVYIYIYICVYIYTCMYIYILYLFVRRRVFLVSTLRLTLISIMIFIAWHYTLNILYILVLMVRNYIIVHLMSTINK